MPPKQRVFKPAPNLPLTEKCKHYERKGEVPWDIQKYWSQRYSIFQHYDYGIYMTDEAWYGVTPEPVATQIAQSPHIPARPVLVDLFAGAGGNAIAFALAGRWERVIAIEKDPSVLACAQRNAAVYEVDEWITFVLGDSFEYLDALRKAERKNAAEGDSTLLTLSGATTPGRKGGAEAKTEAGGDEEVVEEEEIALPLQINLSSGEAVIFASPPWGGPGYVSSDIFDLSSMEPYNLATLHHACRGLMHALFLPRTSDLRQIAALLPDDDEGEAEGSKKRIEVVQYCMEGASKALVAYIPAFGSAL